MGQFAQCLKTESEDGFIKGKYCIASLTSQFSLSKALEDNIKRANYSVAITIRKKARNLVYMQKRDENDAAAVYQPGITWAICLPSLCTDNDVTEIFNFIVNGSAVSCQTKDDLNPPLDTGAIISILILGFFALLLVGSTSLDLYSTFNKREVRHVALTAFSVYSNGRKLFRISKNSGELTCLNGIRFLSMMWVIIGHIFSMVYMAPIVNFKDVMEWVESSRSMTIASGTLSVDSFFLMSGALLVYGYFKSKHNRINFNIFQFYFHRFLRITPALAATVLVSANLAKYMGSGPKWNYISVLEDGCKKYWWSILTYTQNYVVSANDMCLPHTWYLCIDMQLYLISPLILIPLWKYPKLGLTMVLGSIATFVIVPFAVAYSTGIPALITNFKVDTSLIEDFYVYYYMKTHTRPAPWCIGLALGYLLAKIEFEGKFTYTLNKIIVVSSWVVCLVVLITCVYGGHSDLLKADYNQLENSFYIGFVRPVWAACLAWVIFACVSGHGGPINWFLSWPVYQVLNRFTYSVYLLHYPLLQLLVFTLKTGVYFDDLSAAYLFWGITMFSFGISIIWVLAFESPVVVIEKNTTQWCEKG
ncbi:hypothetical protein NQ315_005792 [Exocentrus adspersus]|uniref:Nose resistant to fluoxetine protein 6 n=1 Tax=Exocentrus adspersus TaxID=1586481 RepID=A0AAV8VR37_9CUCU|nr:hypothetical protein NQ315_005792 [Exocentrus adspersus]